MPKSYGIALGILSALLIIQALFARRRAALAAAPIGATANETPRAEVQAALRAAGMLAIGIVYVFALPYLGYIVSLALLIAATAWYQERAFGRWLWVIAIVGAVVFWIIFVQVLQIDEPAGIWPSFF
jgi:hypothetical protein